MNKSFHEPKDFPDPEKKNQGLLPNSVWKRLLSRVFLDPFEVTLTRVLYRLSHSRRPWIKKPLTGLMLRRFKIDMQEALDSNPDHYARFADLFTRELRPGLRPIDPRPHVVVSSVDGCISQVGKIENDGNIIELEEKRHSVKSLSIKGIRYSLLDLLGGLKSSEARYLGGAYNNTYLAPHDYHRMHMPLSGKLLHMMRVSGRLRSVNQRVQLDAPEPVMTTNERVILEFENLSGQNFALVFVGAVGVSGIATPWVDFRHPRQHWLGHRTENQEHEIYEVQEGRLMRQSSDEKAVGRMVSEACPGKEPFFLEKGAQVGIFEMGSTVVALFAPDFQLHWLPNAVRGNLVKMGEAVGECVIKNV